MKKHDNMTEQQIKQIEQLKGKLEAMKEVPELQEFADEKIKQLNSLLK